MPATTLERSDDDVLRTLHPDCPDWQRLGPTRRDAAIRAAAEAQRIATEERESAWSGGFNRRTFLAGGLGVGVAALGDQLVTSRVSYASAADAGSGTLVVVFLRGGMDGLSMLVPTDEPDLLAKLRPGIGIRAASTLAFDTGFGLHPAMKPLAPLIAQGRVAAVPAVSTPDITRSHFQAQDCLERGSSGSISSGWLDRVLSVAGTGTTFRSVAMGGTTPRSLLGTSHSLAMQSLDSMKLPIGDQDVKVTEAALRSLYTGIDHPIALQTALAVEAMGTAASIRKAQTATTDATVYPKGNFGDALRNVAMLIKARTGVRVACIDVGGWDTHTAMGTADSGDMQQHLGDLAAALAAFAADLGDDLDSTTVVTMSEFGRRIEQNASGGTDHGHGGAVLVLGGKVHGGVHGTWNHLGDRTEYGDLRGANDYRDVLADVVMGRLGLSAGAMATVFPGHRIAVSTTDRIVA